MIYVEWMVLVWFPFIVESSNNVGAGSSQHHLDARMCSLFNALRDAHRVLCHPGPPHLVDTGFT